jgi:hypothetical protein
MAAAKASISAAIDGFARSSFFARAIPLQCETRAWQTSRATPGGSPGPGPPVAAVTPAAQNGHNRVAALLRPSTRAFPSKPLTAGPLR